MKSGLKLILYLAILFLIAGLFTNWAYNLISMLNEENKEYCFNKMVTNATYDSIKDTIYMNGDGECIHRFPITIRTAAFREQGTLSYFLFGSGAGTSVRYTSEVIN